jgi:DNA-binding beta-propeller fold protein YncE
MILAPASPPAHVQIFSGFDYVTSDADRRRIYAAHTGSDALLVVNADTGKILGQVDVGGPLHGVAVDPQSGHVFTGDGLARTVSEVDPVAMTVVRTADVDGNVDAIAYDPALHRIYADEDDGTHVFVVDAKTMKQVAAVPIPGHKPEYLAIDPQTHDVYQNIDNLGEMAVISGSQLKVTRTIATPVIEHNHPLQYDTSYHIIMVGGKNATLAAYSRDGALLGTATIQQSVDQCDYNPNTRLLACAGSGKVVVLKLNQQGQLSVATSLDVPKAVHTLAFDRATGHLWIVWSEDKGDFIQEFELKP